MLKKVIIGFVLLVSSYSLSWSADDSKDVTIGFKVMIGGRYDNMRMCVASPADSKGGLIADVMFLTRVQVNDEFAFTTEIPVMRPILFAAAFKMLQFEPQVNFEFTHKVNDDMDFRFGPAIGLSFHYGPDYKSDNKDKRGESFFAMGPMISGFSGIGYTNSKGKYRSVNLKAFYIPLFSGARDDLSPGTVIGGVIEEQFFF